MILKKPLSRHYMYENRICLNASDRVERLTTNEGLLVRSPGREGDPHR